MRQASIAATQDIFAAMKKTGSPAELKERPVDRGTESPNSPVHYPRSFDKSVFKPFYPSKFWSFV